MVVSYVVELIVLLLPARVTCRGPGRWMPPLVLQLLRLGVAAPGGELPPDRPQHCRPQPGESAGLPGAPPGLLQAGRPWRSCGVAPALPDQEGQCGPQSFGPWGQPLPYQQLAGVEAPSPCWPAGLEGVA